MNSIFRINLKPIGYDFVFITMGYICLYFYSKYASSNFNPIPISAAILVAITLIYIIPIGNNKNNYVYQNKNALYPFIMVYIVLLSSIFILNKLFSLNNSTVRNFNPVYLLIIQLVISASIFICYFFKIRITDFNWHISRKSFAFVIIVFIVYRFIFNFNDIISGIINIRQILNLEFIIDFALKAVINSVYPAFYEELLFRGLLISGLKGFELSNNTCNIMQAIIFGTTHIMSWGEPSCLEHLLALSIQIMIGYLLGKLYFKTNSLLPCILFHGLNNTI
ncbi:CPBP family intramembrane glutamic endopeptidase [Clostridium scatologenes]|uniref:CAAX prenyl protease 2/Lysostaphin resistance protein A-like domain-containing protein n=1 Tax=Clostridium scatologenes TaxID=1548 RepID=A0A0E3K215_CLOSL|nr:CPBP family intramembrane glutamic endopeptidase [Clostridium scatologenes]AKA70405.1 hypothetical protein CSCA_3280 [Clostridium scatologenes]